MHKVNLCACCSVALLLIAAPALAQVVVSEMTPPLVLEAIAAGEQGKVADGYIVKTNRMLGGETHLATFSTPFMRVASAAREAKRQYRKFTAADVTPEMIAPELHVYAWPQAIGPASANVRAVVMTPRKGSEQEKADRVVQPARFEPLPMQFKNLLGATFEGEGKMAVFPLSALSEDNEVHVVFDREIVIGKGGYRQTCDNCAEKLSLKNVR